MKTTRGYSSGSFMSVSEHGPRSFFHIKVGPFALAYTRENSYTLSKIFILSKEELCPNVLLN